MYRHAPGTIWRRAVKRVDRRAATVRALRPMAYANAPIIATGELVWSHCDDCERAAVLLREAVRLANTIASVA
jgi:hypothetical protein